ncbi:acyltransferase family protein [Longimicrobium sp.]|uniref:acyltransferase family protein n=1 Tax=Longimicrobium sp. TaxID=2029185 RepID=UPI003B3A114A
MTLPLPPTEPHGGTAPTDEPAHIPALDGLRGCAVLGVLLLHFTSAMGAPAGAPARLVKQAFSLGWTGVDLFFVLSGFLITGILADARNTPHRYRTFYMRRALRILPLYYGFVVLLFAVPPLVGARAYTTTFADQLPYWLYLQNFRPLPNAALDFAGHLWSLAIEEQFYLVWPLVIFTLSRTNALRVCAACLVGALAYRVTAVLAGADLHAVYFQTPARLDGLALGGAIALMLRGAGGRARLRRIAPAALAASAAALAGAALHPSGFDPGGAYMVAVGYSALAFFFGAVLVLALDGRSAPLPRLLSGSVLRFFGRYSYGLYVLHVPLIGLGRLAGASPDRFAGTRWEFPGLLGYTALMTAASILAALACWNAYEKHFLKLKARFTYRPPAAAS